MHKNYYEVIVGNIGTVYSGARWPEHSTSQTNNVAKQYLTSAFAEFVAEAPPKE